MAAAGAGILTLSLVTAPPVTSVGLPRVEAHAVQLVAATAADISTSVVAPSVRPAAANKTTADATASARPDFLAFAASILEYLNNLGFGAGPGLAAIGLSGFVVAFAAAARVVKPAASSVVTPARRGVATSKRGAQPTANNTASKVRASKKSSTKASSGTGSSKRGR